LDPTYRRSSGLKSTSPAQSSLPLAGLGPAIHVFKPADRKDLHNRGYLGGSGQFFQARDQCFMFILLFCGEHICVLLCID
jgi:hypothetical protein